MKHYLLMVYKQNTTYGHCINWVVFRKYTMVCRPMSWCKRRESRTMHCRNNSSCGQLAPSKIRLRKHQKISSSRDWKWLFIKESYLGDFAIFRFIVLSVCVVSRWSLLCVYMSGIPRHSHAQTRVTYSTTVRNTT